jgi:hypothetical protein
MTVIQVHPDEDSLALHLGLARERIARAYEFLTTARIDIYGTPSEALVDQIRQMGAGAPPITFNVATAGFSRLASVAV